MNADFYRLKPEHDGAEYPWPCEPHPDRTIELFDDDVLTKQANGNYTKHTGLGCFDIHIPDDHLDGYSGWPAMLLNDEPYGKYQKPIKVTA